MLEILGIILLSNVNRKNALARGRKPGGFIALTICLWLGLEFLGAFIGIMAKLGFGSYILAIVMAAIGAVISYLVAKNCKPGTYVPSAPMMQNYTANVEPLAGSGPPQMQYAAMPYSGNEQGTPTSFCHKCGAPLIEGALFCGNCGQQRFIQVETANTWTPETEAAVLFPFNSEETVPYTVKPMRAVWTAVWVIGAWIMIFITHIFLGIRLLYCNAVSAVIVNILFGTGMYLLMQKSVKYKVFAAGTMVIAVLINIFNYYLLHIPLLRESPFRLKELFTIPISPLMIISILLRAFVVAGGALFFAWLLGPKQQREPSLNNGTTAVSDMRAKVEKKRVWQTALYTVLVGVPVCIIFILATSPIYLQRPLFLLQFLIGCLLTAMTLIFTPPALHGLSTMSTKHIRLSGWGLVWCWLCVAGMLFSLVMCIIYAVSSFAAPMYSSQLFMSITLLTGFIMLIARRRSGWYVILFGAYISLVGQFDESLSAVIQGANHYIPFLIGAIFGSLNPLITWLSIRGAWRASDIRPRF